MRRLAVALLALLTLTSCHRSRPIPGSVTFMIESSPTNLDPRIGIDAQSQHIDELIFDGLVVRDAQFNFAPSLALSWQQPDPLTLVFHLRPGVLFHNGRPLTARDVAWTLNSLRNGTVISPRAATYVAIASIQTPDPLTVVLHLNQPDNFLLANLARGAIGVVPEGSGRDFGQHPIGTGPFRFVRQEVDKEVVLERSPTSWEPDPGPAHIQRIRFAVVPDGITRALELRKGSADIASNSIMADALPILAQDRNLIVASTGGTMVQYLAFNTVDPALRDPRIRQAIACSIDRELIRNTLLGGRARLALSLLPAGHWAYSADVPLYTYNPARARQLLDASGHPPGPGGIRLHLTMKTSTDEGTRLLAATLQQQFAQVGIALDIRSFETATFVQDLTRGAFQLYSLRWIGGNEQPDILSYAFSSSRMPPKGANRGRYSNPQLDRLLDDAARNPDQAQRRIDYVQAQQILARDLPALPLWYQDSVLVYNRRLTHITLSPSGSYTFLLTAFVDAQIPQP